MEQDTEREAAAQAALQRVKRAQGQLAEATRELAQLAGDFTVVGMTRVHDERTAAAAQEYVRLGTARHGAVDVVVIARPTGRRSRQPTTAPTGAKEKHHEHDGNGRAAGSARERGAVSSGR